MTVTFKKCTSNPKTAVKSFSYTKTVQNIQPFERLDDLTGTLILEYDPEIEACNYCEFEDEHSNLTMKYFITGKDRDIGGRLVLTLKLDALSTYWSQIKKCEAIVRTTTYSGTQEDPKGWTKMIQGDRMVYSYQMTHASDQLDDDALDFDPRHFFMGIYG